MRECNNQDCPNKEMVSGLICQIKQMKYKVKKIKEKLHNPEYDHGYVHLKGKDFEFMKKDRQIVKRLEDRIKQIPEENQYEVYLANEIQKILGYKR